MYVCIYVYIYVFLCACMAFYSHTMRFLAYIERQVFGANFWAVCMPLLFVRVNSCIHVCVFMYHSYMYIFVCGSYLCTHMHTYLGTLTNRYIYIHIYIYICTHTHTQIDIRHAYILTYTRMQTKIRHTHTHTHTQHMCHAKNTQSTQINTHKNTTNTHHQPAVQPCQQAQAQDPFRPNRSSRRLQKHHSPHTRPGQCY